MWEPEPGWLALPGGTGVSTVGVWRTVVGDRAVAVKRLAAPDDFDPAELSDPRHFAYWRRAADVATYGLVDATPGLRAPTTSVEEDADGLTIVQEWVEDAANSGLFIAHAMGRFAGAGLGHVRWLARNQLRDRLARVERRGGWSTLGRTTASDIDALPQVAQHGDPVPGNLLGRDGDDLIAVDWGSLGCGPVGGDLGYYLLMAREEFEPLLDAYLLGLPAGLATPEQVTLGARITAVYTVFTRADWALARVAGGEGALAAKFRHPAVAPHLRALQRQTDAVTALLDL
jgi:hypothetical protein